MSHQKPSDKNGDKKPNADSDELPPKDEGKNLHRQKGSYPAPNAEDPEPNKRNRPGR